ncbi:leucyl aminopeptidase [Tistlia consotensis]|uniref:Probable cytosol aminopeptidase n=1 Tax=Tistlia consotensis USBA 355 TaxID=560819 RepID=A0A1Y6CXE8_9PROT|nr:leucyl aminopeptidase [Tistlia consotensis]SMF83352.1 leucyl aminopeptidase [Tistlia consotensis USBA 355]SNS32662.1 leucyl aminopeptidase [Tistlia consotensis]
MRIAFAAPTVKTAGTLVVAVTDEKRLSASAAAVDEATGGAVGRAIAGSRFTGKRGQLLEILAPAGIDSPRVLLLGLGKPTEITGLELENAGGKLVGQLNAVGETSASIAVDTVEGTAIAAVDMAAHIAFGARLRSYRFDKYKTKEGADKKLSLGDLTFHVKEPKKAQKRYDALSAIVDGVFLTRDVVSEPANVIFPESFVERARKLEKLGVRITVLGEKEMRKLGMGALLGVGQGSTRESQLLVMEWHGSGRPQDAKKGDGKKARTKAGHGEAPLCFVGKGVCFDTGGISIKPAGGMEDMKWDMGGAGTVLGLMHALASRKARVGVVGICGLVENMPDGNAQRPGDVVTSASGQTIEVINTDAEGRLVLADALWYAQETYRPRMIVDLATLTGAIIVSLGKEHAGLFANDDSLADSLIAAGKAVGETVWRMPLGEAYDRMIDSDIADMKNVGSRYGGSITAAQFLQRFVNEGTPWAHLDIAGMAWSDKDKPTVPKGATAFGVRLLDRLVGEHYEK